MLTKLIPQKTEDALQQAVQAELYTSHLYKHLANQCQRLGLFGAAKYFKHESAEELEHYQGIADYLNDQGAVAEVPVLEACDEEVASLKDALEIAYGAEVDLGSKYARWYSNVDPMAQQFLLGYLEIQRKSIGTYADWLQRLSLGGKDECAVLIVDAELGK